MRNIKDIKAEVNTITYDKDKIEEKVGSIYEAIVIMGKRAEQINSEIRTELHNKLDEFAVRDTSLEEVFENREQIEISKYYEKTDMEAAESVFKQAFAYPFRPSLFRRRDALGLAAVRSGLQRVALRLGQRQRGSRRFIYVGFCTRHAA